MTTASEQNPIQSLRGPARFVLVETSHPGNVGSVARAMKVMGFEDLVLVRPQLPDVLSHPQALALASGATDVLEQARVVQSLPEALEGVDHVCATVMTPRDFGPPTHSPRAHFSERAAAGHRLALVFGSERHGLSNEDVYLCHACLSIPTAPAYGSLNLAQAVQLLAYEWRQALGSFPVVPRTEVPQWADAASVQRLLGHWEQALAALGYLDPAAPKKLMPRLNQLINRAQITQQELHILHGVARAALDAGRARRCSLGPQAPGAAEAPEAPKSGLP